MSIYTEDLLETTFGKKRPKSIREVAFIKYSTDGDKYYLDSDPRSNGLKHIEIKQQQLTEIEKKYYKLNTDRNVYTQLQLLPRINKNSEETLVDMLYFCGPPGSGKSYHINQYLKCYKKINKNNPIFIISNKTYEDNDKTYFDISPNYINSANNETWIDVDGEEIDSFNANDFKDCCIVFDDCLFGCDSPKIKQKVIRTIDNITSNARSRNVTVIIANQKMKGGRDTQYAIANCNLFYLFPFGDRNRCVDFVKTYVSKRKNIIDLVENTKSQFMIYSKNAPSFIMLEDQIVCL